MRRNAKKKNGHALLAALSIMTVLSLTLGMLVRLGQQRAFTAKRLVDRVKAQAYAEAGIDYAYALLSPDFEKRNDPSAFSLDPQAQTASLSSSLPAGSHPAVTSSYGDGSFTLTLATISNRYVIVGSEGKCGTEATVAEALVEDIYAGSGGSTAPDYANMEGFNYAILSGGQFSFKGCGTLAGAPVAKMHSNSAIDINGAAQTQVDVSSSAKVSVGNNTVNGTVTAPALSLHKHANITGGATQASVSPIAIPDIDLTPYYNWASQHGEVHNGFSTSSSYTPNGGVLYVIGNANISSHAVINGSIIATGDIKVSGAVQIRPTDHAFAMATETGSIDNTSSSTIRGLVYAKKGNYKQTANGRLEGQIIVGGTVQKGGNSDVLLFSQHIPVPPGTGSVTPTQSLPLISAWQR